MCSIFFYPSHFFLTLALFSSHDFEISALVKFLHVSVSDFVLFSCVAVSIHPHNAIYSFFSECTWVLFGIFPIKYEQLHNKHFLKDYIF